MKPLARFFIMLSASSLLMSGCLPTQEESLDFIEQEAPTHVIPAIQVEEKYYRGLSPFKESESRGSLQTHLQNYRLDADRLELGLIEIAQDHFTIDEHLFREGQFINKNDLSQWLRIKNEQYRLGLNPEGSTERVLVHILEHNYWDLKGESIEGIVIGLSLASQYTEEIQVETDSGQTTTQRETRYYQPDELRIMGQEMADEITQRMRARLPESHREIPMIFALYQLEERGSLIPGNFLSVGIADNSDQQVTEWKTINETYFLFPSNALSRFDEDWSTTYSDDFASLRDEVQDFFPNYVGIVGKGRFVNEQMVELTIEVNTEFASKTEVIQLTQFLAATAMDNFSEHVHLNIYVKSVNEPQSVFVRPVDGEQMMHIYR